MIYLSEFKKAYEVLKLYVNNTDLVKLKNNIFLKKESMQKTNSFKWSGVLYSVIIEFDKILKSNTKDDKKYKSFYLVTQSTGNHGIAVIYTIIFLIEKYIELYPEYTKLWLNIIPVIFTNKTIKSNKLNKMQEAINIYKKKFKNNGFIDSSYPNYKYSLIARTEFLKKNNGIYLQHGGKNIMTGYGSIAFQIDNQLPKNKSVALYTAIGAGGPLGIGLCLSKLRDTEIIICQTENFDAFIRSLESKELKENKENNETSISDGIAVDKPEEYAFQLGQNIINKSIRVKTENVIELQKKYNLGGSSCIALESLNIYKSNKDYIVILDCEGN
jgi:threonine dehydratase